MAFDVELIFYSKWNPVEWPRDLPRGMEAFIKLLCTLQRLRKCNLGQGVGLRLCEQL